MENWKIRNWRDGSLKLEACLSAVGGEREVSLSEVGGKVEVLKGSTIFRHLAIGFQQSAFSNLNLTSEINNPKSQIGFRLSAI